MELRGLEPLTPCMQSPSKLSSTVSGLAGLSQSIHPNPAASRLVGVGRGCQVALAHRIRLLTRLTLEGRCGRISPSRPPGA